MEGLTGLRCVAATGYAAILPGMTTGADILATAKSYIGKLHDGPDVVTMCSDLARAYPADAAYWRQASASTPWCGIFIAWILLQLGIPVTGPYGDIGPMFVDWYLGYGIHVPVGQQQPGDIKIYLGGPHHVTLEGENGTSVGGNQSDGVTETRFRQPDAVRRVQAASSGAAPQPQTFDHSGKGSWYSQFTGKYEWADTGDAPGSAALGVPDNAQGVSFYDRSTLGHWFEVRAPNGVVSIEQQTDIGPHPNTGRTIDISAAAAERFGYSPRNFPTDSVFQWRAISAPAAVAGLSPQQQAAQFRDLRKGKPMDPTVTPLPPMPSPVPAVQRPDMLANMMQYFMTNPESFERIAAFMGALRGQPAPAAAPPAAPAAPAPTGLAAIFNHLSDGSNLSFWTGIGTLLASVGLNAGGVMGSPGGPEATVIGQLIPAAGAALSAGGGFTKLASLTSKLGGLIPLLAKVIAIIPK